MFTRKEHAVALLEEGLSTLRSGWMQGEYREYADEEDEYGDNKLNRVCAIGSLGMTDYTPETQAEEDAICFLWNALPRHWKQQTEKVSWDKGEAIVNYNDKTGRKRAHVERVFERAIQLAKDEPLKDS